jgi:hypothetical protein
MRGRTPHALLVDARRSIVNQPVRYRRGSPAGTRRRFV